MNEEIFDKRRLKTFSNCKDLVKSMIGTKEGFIAYNEKFRLDLENTCYKANMYEDLQQERDKYKSMWDELKKRVDDTKRKIPRNRRYKYKLAYGIEEIPEKEHNNYINFLVFEVMERLIKELEEGVDNEENFK